MRVCLADKGGSLPKTKPERARKAKEKIFWIEEENPVLKDVFIILCGLSIIILIFFVYRLLTGPDFQAASLPSGQPVIDPRGHPLDQEPVNPFLARTLLQIGIISFSIGLLTFLSFFLALRWPKNITRHWITTSKKD